MVESIKGGVFPFWNSYIVCGNPFFATLQAGVFYPIHFLFYLLSFDLAFNLTIIIHYPLAFIFTYLLCRELKMSFTASVISGLSFAYSGYMLSVLHMPSSLAAATWLPLVILFFRRALYSIGFWKIGQNLILTSVFMVLMYLGGEPTILFGTLLFILLYLIYLSVRDKRIYVKYYMFLFLSCLMFVAMSAVQLFPFAELAVHSSRRGGIPFKEASFWSLAPERLISFIIPYFFHSGTSLLESSDWLKSCYMGTITMFLALFALLFVKKRRIIGLALLFSLILAFGKYTPVYFLFFKFVPFFSSIRYPQKFLFITTFLFAILAGFGLDSLSKKLKEERRSLDLFFKYYWAVILIVVMLFSIVYFAPHLLVGLLKFLFSITKSGEGLVRIIAQKNIVNLGIMGFFLLLILFLIKGVKSVKLLKIFFCLLLIFDLFLSNFRMNDSMPKRYYDTYPTIIKTISRDHDLFRAYPSPSLSAEKLITYTDEMKGGRSLRDLRAILFANQNILSKTNLIIGYVSVVRKDAIFFSKLMHRLDTLERGDIVNMLNIKYLLSPNPLHIRGYKLVEKSSLEAHPTKIFLYENLNVLPRSYIVPRYKKIEKKEDRAFYLAGATYEAEREVVLEEDIPAYSPPKGRSDRLYSTKILKYEQNEVVIEANLKKNGILFISDTYYPGWRVTVDGKEAKIYKANYVFRAVPLTPGKHKIVFYFESDIFKIGLLTSIFTIIGFIIFFVICHKKRIN